MLCHFMSCFFGFLLEWHAIVLTSFFLIKSRWGGLGLTTFIDCRWGGLVLWHFLPASSFFHPSILFFFFLVGFSFLIFNHHVNFFFFISSLWLHKFGFRSLCLSWHDSCFIVCFAGTCIKVLLCQFFQVSYIICLRCHSMLVGILS